MKKSMALLLIPICILFSACRGTATEQSQDNDTWVIAKIEETIVRFYKNKDLAETNDYTVILDETVSTYLESIIRATSSSRSDKENYSVELKILEKEKTKDELKLTYQVITTFNYVMSPDVPTTVSNEIQIVYNYNRGLITEFYDPLGFSV